ncbi:protein containing DUF29, partial [Candidatus Magnetobacterium bavaricum]
MGGLTDVSYIMLAYKHMDTLTHNETLTGRALYEVDFYQWTFHNADLLRQGRFAEIDIENIAEELEDMGRSSKRELASRLAVLIMHLLKWQYQPKRRRGSWSTTIGNQRREIKRLLEDNPSLRYNIETVIAKEFIEAKLVSSLYSTVKERRRAAPPP